jgi:predicted amidohydrolase
MIAPREQRLAAAEALDGLLVTSYRELALRHGIWLLLGSFAELTADPNRLHNTSVLIDAQGMIRAVYRKIHLFDASPPDGVPYRESDTVTAGQEVVTADSPWGRLGLSICYDVRFPELYRQLSSRGATLLTVPSAFTVPTGRAHWEVLLRARAIENLAFVVAPAQVGDHGHGRKSYGHSMIVSPWGEVLAEGEGDAPGVIVADISSDAIDKARAMIPALSHRRLA